MSGNEYIPSAWALKSHELSTMIEHIKEENAKNTFENAVEERQILKAKKDYVDEFDEE